MSGPQTRAPDTHVAREARQQAGIPALMRRWLRVSFFELDVILVDLTSSGIKLELHYDVRARLNDRFWLIVPAFDPVTGDATADASPVVLQAACRWYNPRTMQLGAAVTRIDRKSAEKLLGMIDQLRRSGRGVV